MSRRQRRRLGEPNRPVSIRSRLGPGLLSISITRPCFVLLAGGQIAAMADRSASEYSGISSRSWPMTAPTNQTTTATGWEDTSRAAAYAGEAETGEQGEQVQGTGAVPAQLASHVSS